MDKFYIDRQFGIPIWIDVEKSIVINVTGETERFNNKMMEEYGGKSITFLKKDFEERMKPAYYNVRPEAITVQKNLIDKYQTLIRQAYNKISSLYTTDDERLTLYAQITKNELLLSHHEKYLKFEKERLFSEHNFVV